MGSSEKFIEICKKMENESIKILSDIIKTFDNQSYDVYLYGPARLVFFKPKIHFHFWKSGYYPSIILCLIRINDKILPTYIDQVFDSGVPFSTRANLKEIEYLVDNWTKIKDKLREHISAKKITITEKTEKQIFDEKISETAKRIEDKFEKHESSKENC